jgi:hypothetical protein
MYPVCKKIGRNQRKKLRHHFETKQSCLVLFGTLVFDCRGENLLLLLLDNNNLFCYFLLITDK